MISSTTKSSQSKNAFSMQQIAKVLDKANKDDIKQLKELLWLRTRCYTIRFKCF
jgi:heterodisulfide reductase subunit C